MLFAMDLEKTEELASKRQDFVIGSLGLIGRHLPNLVAEFVEDSVIKCDASAVCFEGMSQLFCPSSERQLPFFRCFEACADTRAIPASALPSEFLLTSMSEFVLVKICNRLEIILHYLAFLHLSESSQDWPYWTISRPPLDDELVYRCLASHARTPEIRDVKKIAEGCVRDRLVKCPLPEGGALVTRLNYELLYCSLAQYRWVLGTKTLFQSTLAQKTPSAAWEDNTLAFAYWL
jgi:hypothetical protein